MNRQRQLIDNWKQEPLELNLTVFIANFPETTNRGNEWNAHYSTWQYHSHIQWQQGYLHLQCKILCKACLAKTGLKKEGIPLSPPAHSISLCWNKVAPMAFTEIWIVPQEDMVKMKNVYNDRLTDNRKLIKATKLAVEKHFLPSNLTPT